MALLFANHTATVFARIETADPMTKEVPVPTEGGGSTITCQIRPLGNTVVLDAETSVELLNPHEMKVEPEDYAVPIYGARVLWHDTLQEFRITNRLNRHEAGGELAVLDHGSVEMELLDIEVDLNIPAVS